MRSEQELADYRPPSELQWEQKGGGCISQHCWSCNKRREHDVGEDCSWCRTCGFLMPHPYDPGHGHTEGSPDISCDPE